VSRNEPLVTIARFPTAFDASLAKGALEACGIEAFVPGEDLGTFTTNRAWVPVTELRVFESDRDRALAELRRAEIRIVKNDDN
jgi:hypothetical protein